MIEDYLLDYYQRKELDKEIEITPLNCYSGVQAAEVLPMLIKDLIKKVFSPNYQHD
jgi:hypothetical protein